jgi:hypothetical protein
MEWLENIVTKRKGPFSTDIRRLKQGVAKAKAFRLGAVPGTFPHLNGNLYLLI